MEQNPLIGTWRLVSMENRTADGEVSYPYGPDAAGYLMYSENGMMAVAIMSANRPKFAVGDILGGATTEKAAAAETYLSYIGHYTLLPDRVIHHVEVGFFPNWVGTDQERFTDLNGDRLTLRSPSVLMGGTLRTIHLIWERI